jgi:hypothetical protein
MQQGPSAALFRPHDGLIGHALLMAMRGQMELGLAVGGLAMGVRQGLLMVRVRSGEL